MSAAPAWIRRIADPRERVVARFMLKVKKTDSGCWLWTAATDDDGYGTFQYAGPLGDRKREKRRANRVSYELFNGTLAPEDLVRHTCDNTSCVNPAHLVLGTTEQNVADRVARRRSARGDRHGSHTKRHRWFEGAQLRRDRAAAVRTVTLVIPRRAQA